MRYVFPRLFLLQDKTPAEEPVLTMEEKYKRRGLKVEVTKTKEEEEIDMILAELDGPKEEAEEEVAHATLPDQDLGEADATANGVGDGEDEIQGKKLSKKDRKKMKKKAAKIAKADDDDDIDALLAEIDGPGAKAVPHSEDARGSGDAADTSKDKSPAATAATTSGAVTGESEDGAADGDADADDAADVSIEGKELTANQKKKLKKKQKEKEAKLKAAAEGSGDTITKKGEKKESAAVRRMREALEARNAAEEAARLAEEERIREEEERIRQEEEAEKRAIELREKKKEEKKARREQMRKEGRLLTAKQKEEQRRLEAMREQLLASGAIPPDASGGDGDGTEVKKKVVYGKKKKHTQVKKTTALEEVDTELGNAASLSLKDDVKEGGSQGADADTKTGDAKAEEEMELGDWDEREWDEKEEEEEENDRTSAAMISPVVEGIADSTDVVMADAGHAEASGDAEDEDDSANDDDDDDEDDDSSDYSSSEYTSSSDYSDSDDEDREEVARLERIRVARASREARIAAAMEARSPDRLRSPICCILGHVDTGKTKLLDKIRNTNVQDGEAGGITQQIGATYIPAQAIRDRTAVLRSQFAEDDMDLKLPALLVIDTPGHESFTNLRSRGSGLCDIAILVVDIMHGLEQQTLESLNLLRMRKTPFVIALNKIDRMFEWNAEKDASSRAALANQPEHVRKEFDSRFRQVALQFNEQGLNVALYWDNPDPRKYVNIIPTSAITGEGVPDMLNMLTRLTQMKMTERLQYVDTLQCTVLEVKMIEGLGTTVDVILINGTLREGDTVVLCGLSGPIVTSIRALLTPHPLRELRVKGSYLHHSEIQAAQGVKITGNNLEGTVAGTNMFVLGKEDDVEELQDAVMEDMKGILSSVRRSSLGVYVQASTLGSLEALLEFLRSDDVQIPVFGISIGPIHKKDVMKASVMHEHKKPEFATILAFDVKVTQEAKEMAEELNVKIFTADIIYHLFDQFTAYMEKVKREKREATAMEAVFPCVLRIIETCVFNKRDPIVLGVDIVDGIAKVGTPLCVPSKGFVNIGRIASMELSHKPVQTAHKGQSVAMKIQSTMAIEATRMYGRHFDHTDDLVSRLTRHSIDLLKENYRKDLSKEDWILVVKLKKIFEIL